MRKILINLLVIIFTAGVLSANETLDNYLKIAAENNPGLKAKFREYLAAVAKVPQAGALPDPQLSFGYFISPVETRVGPQRAKISLAQKFPWFGKLQAGEDYLSAVANTKYNEFQTMKNKLFLDVRNTWYDLYYIRREKGYIRLLVDFLETLDKIANTRYQSGKARQSDLIRISIKKDDYNNRLNDLDDKEEPLVVKFNKLLNRPSGEEVIIPDSLGAEELSIAENELQDSVFVNNTELKTIEAKEAAAGKKLRSAELSGLPDVTAGIDYVLVDKRTDVALPDNGRDVLMPMVSVNIPLFNPKYSSMEQEAKITEESIREQYNNKRNSLEYELSAALNARKSAGRDITLYGTLIGKADYSLSLLVTEYSTDGAQFNQLLTLKEEIFSYQLRMEKAITDLNKAVAKINYLLSENI